MCTPPSDFAKVEMWVLQARQFGISLPSSNPSPPEWHGSGSLQRRLKHAARPYPTLQLLSPLGSGNHTMRYSRVFPLLTGVALVAACGDGGNGPDNTPPVATFTYQCTDLTCTFTDNS